MGFGRDHGNLEDMIMDNGRWCGLVLGFAFFRSLGWVGHWELA